MRNEAEKRCGRLVTAGLLCCAGVLALLFAASPPVAAEAAFAPALTEDVIDLAQCRQYVNGREAPAQPDRVKRALGFVHAGGNWEENKWEVSGGVDGEETRYDFLIVLKRPVAIGTLAVGPADFGSRVGTVNGGELFYLKADYAGRPDPARTDAWVKAEFAAPAQFMRFCTLPPATRTRALLYRDVRVRGAASPLYIAACRDRLQDVTFAALGTCYPADGSADPAGVPLGKGWSTKPPDGISTAHPVRFTLLWKNRQRLAGIFLCSNADDVKVLVCDSRESDPMSAPDDAWKPVNVIADDDRRHKFQYWEYSNRWISFSPVETAALRVEVGAVTRGGREFWVNGLAAMTPLGDKPPMALAPRETGPPFQIAASFAGSGDAAMVIEDANGRRVRNLFAQTYRPQGASRETWDLKDDSGRTVPPGTYRWKAIVGPQLALEYGVTPYPNIQNYFPERMPWMRGHSGEHGWLSDHCCNWVATTSGDHLFFAASMAEAGSTLIECDLEGRRLWGRHDFGAWQGVYLMSADAHHLYVLATTGKVHRLDLATRKELGVFRPAQGPHRRGYRSGMAAFDGKVVIAYTGEPMIDNAAGADSLDYEHCLPKPLDTNLARLLRMEGTPPGIDVDPRSNKPQGNGRLFLESQPISLQNKTKQEAGEPALELDLTGNDQGDDDPAAAFDDPTRRVAVIAFKRPVPLGSIVFPWPKGEGKLQFAALKPDAPYPPRPDEDNDWVPFASSGGPGWNCIPAPPGTMTRAVRVLFLPKDPAGRFWRLDGLRLLNRRFRNLFPEATVRVSSGQVSPTGEWDARRNEPVGPDNPGIFIMQWNKDQEIAGLAIKEIDGATAEIDVWQGPAPARLPMDAPALDRKSTETGWRNVATYKQQRRISDYVPNANRNAMYMDGYVDFHEVVRTRGVRIRVTEQWLDNGPTGAFCRWHDGRGEHGVHRRNSYCTWLDSRVCKIMGVAPLSPLGDDPKRDPLTYERLEVWDGLTGKLIKEIGVRPGWHSLSFAPDGTLYMIEKNHNVISRVDLETGTATPVITDAQPSTFTVGPKGYLYVFPWTNGCRSPILVYDPQGKRIREIGKPGGFRPGLWDPQRFGQVGSMCVDKNNSLWVVERQDNPRRIVQYKTDGTFVKEILGNTHYGGAGTLDRTDPSRAFHQGVEFAIDWKNHTSRIRAWYGDAFLGGEVVTRKTNGRLYLTTAPLTLNQRQEVGTVYLYNEAEGTVRLAAAMGNAEGFPPLARSDIVALLPEGDVPKSYEFLWFDRNGNGLADPAEVDFRPKQGDAAVGPFDEQLGCVGNGVYYQVTQILPNGAPAYRRTPAPGRPIFRLNDGSWLYLNATPEGEQNTENYVIGPDGRKQWSYPASGGVSGLSIPPWTPGLVTNQLCLIGHETAPAGDLGEFFVVNDNTGQWRIWTADGLLAGNILYHKMDPRAHLFGSIQATFGSRIDPLSASQEHFHGFFTRTEPANRYFIVAGFTNLSIIEVKGIEKFRRTEGTFTVTLQDLERMRRWETDRWIRRNGGRPATLTACYATDHPPQIDGNLIPGEWPLEVKLPADRNVAFRLAYDNTNLYLCWTGKGVGPLRNTPDDLRRIFKTGACLDFMIGADENADPKRAAPVAGDQRLLIAFVDGKPHVMLYQPVAAGAPPDEAWSTRTLAGGETRFDRVVELKDGVTVAIDGDRDFTVEAAIPLNALGLAPSPGMKLKGDWGILTSDSGNQVKMRAYWSNIGATGTADEAVEARLEPAYWGIIEFEAPVPGL